MAIACEAFHAPYGGGVLENVQVKCLQRSDLSRLDLVKWRSAHGQVVKPLIRLGIQPVIRLGVKRDGNLSQFSVNNTSNQLAQNLSGTV